MASNVRLAGKQLDLTVVEDEQYPRAVYCVPITSGEEWSDALYLDLPAEQAEPAVFDFVRAAARQVSFAVQGILNQEQAAWIRQVDQQLALARDMQDRLIPKRLDLSPAVDLALAYEPAFWVGGDYCDVWPLPDGRIAFAVGDVAGKGLPAALVMANLHAALRTGASFRPEPAEVVSSVRGHLTRYLSDEMFVTMILGFLEPASGRLEYVNAGHILPLVFPPEGPPSELGQPTNPPLGFLEAAYRPQTVTLEPGSGLVVVTDGVTESRSPAGKMLKPAGLLGALSREGFANAKDLVRLVTEAAGTFREHLPAQDDVTVMAILRRGAAAN
jgi:serine phosphatase RsbU (regulator of sigma subunit)